MKYKNKTVCDIVAEYLQKHGYDGLCNREGDGEMRYIKINRNTMAVRQHNGCYILHGQKKKKI